MLTMAVTDVEILVFGVFTACF